MEYWLILLGFLIIVVVIGGVVYRLLFFIDSILEKKRLPAEIRARELMSSLLTEEEKNQIESEGYLEVQSRISRGRTYQIPFSRSNIRVYEEGRFVGSLCIVPKKWIPLGDLVLAHRLMLQGSEESYWKIANFYRGG